MLFPIASMRLKKCFPTDLMHKQFCIQAFSAYVSCLLHIHVFYPMHLEAGELWFKLLPATEDCLVITLLVSKYSGILWGKEAAMKCRAKVQQPCES